ncbi:MAG: alpha-mannosidase [Candidatus Omnitrophota bacterium]|jgi:alpha-mannosidase|nr:MAG: alpha-mannosidase [Candidatus Omnitrophota bacterium]
MKRVHLICNAHIDPVWLWEWQEGAAATLSTFRTAADLCEEYPTFIFNHNEAILYQWIEEYEPLLFTRIQTLVKAGKWHIMGGWFLQPDCNMPSGESFVRHILHGKRYFKQQFRVEPTTAINFDPFGHSRGLVQILAKSGYDSYLFCRPNPQEYPLPADDFLWIGCDGSQIFAHRAYAHYNSELGQARKKVEQCIAERPDPKLTMILWGIGNHGGGPSRVDVNDLQNLIESSEQYEIIHSTPEQYFKELKERNPNPPRHENDINPFSPGCYTSQIRIKQKHRRLENELYATEKMMSSAALQGLLLYPAEEFQAALRDLLFSEFHDILPGSAIQPVEENALQLLDHGLEIVSRLRTRAFFALAGGQPKAADGEFPILIYNPHPFPVNGIFECEFHMIEPNRGPTFHQPVLLHNGNRLPCQPEKEHCNLDLEWRKRIAFTAQLAPSAMNRFDCRLELIPQKLQIQMQPQNDHYVFHNDQMHVEINRSTGLIDSYKINEVEYVKPNAFQPIVMRDNDDSWGMFVKSFPHPVGEFRLLSAEECAEFLGSNQKRVEAVRVIEDGEVRTVIEALFTWHHSIICQRYKIPKHGSEIEVEIHAHWHEKSRMLKLSIPIAFEKVDFLGQTAFGMHHLPCDSDEAVAQKWLAVCSKTHNAALTCVNDGTYGADYRDGCLRLSLLRSPGYSAANINPQESILPTDRYSPRIDQGERHFHFWINAGEKRDRMNTIDREALIHNEKPTVLSFSPSGDGSKPKPLIMLKSGDGEETPVQLSTFKKAESDDHYIIRLFNPTEQEQRLYLQLPPLALEMTIPLSAYEIKSLKLNVETNKLIEVNLLEDPM